jgi:hypothetical protein
MKKRKVLLTPTQNPHHNPASLFPQQPCKRKLFKPPSWVIIKRIYVPSFNFQPTTGQKEKTQCFTLFFDI